MIGSDGEKQYGRAWLINTSRAEHFLKKDPGRSELTAGSHVHPGSDDGRGYR
jgi:hypothetical protein